MTLHTALAFIFTILASVSIVAAIILLGELTHGTRRGTESIFYMLYRTQIFYMIFIFFNVFYRLVSHLEGLSIKISIGSRAVGSRGAGGGAAAVWRGTKSERSSTQGAT